MSARVSTEGRREWAGRGERGKGGEVRSSSSSSLSLVCWLVQGVEGEGRGSNICRMDLAGILVDFFSLMIFGTRSAVYSKKNEEFGARICSKRLFESIRSKIFYQDPVRKGLSSHARRRRKNYTEEQGRERRERR